jgi:hypothetical protein
MSTIVKRDELTIEINPIPSEKLEIRKRPERGILTCDRCRHVEANAERDQNGWELWYLLQRYTDLCPACVPVVTSICGESRRIPSPQFLAEGESYSTDPRLKEDPWKGQKVTVEDRNRPLIREQAFGELLDPDKLERLGRYEVPQPPGPGERLTYDGIEYEASLSHDKKWATWHRI